MAEKPGAYPLLRYSCLATILLIQLAILPSVRGSKLSNQLGPLTRVEIVLQGDMRTYEIGVVRVLYVIDVGLSDSSRAPLKCK